VLSGLIVTLITRYLFSRRDNREYVQKVEAVNREVVYALRPGISEGHIPTEEVLESLINATARKYRVSRDDTFQPKQIAEELIKQVMDSSFISSETKKNYCETLDHLVRAPGPSTDLAAARVELKVAESDYRARMVTRMSSILGLTAAMVTMLTVFTRIVDRPASSPLANVFDVLVPTMVVLVATLVAMAAMLSARTLRSRRRGDQGEKSKPSEAKRDDG
jgi:hypothetical protein